MKIKTTVTDITHDDLVNLLSTATYGSDYFFCKVPKGSYNGTKLEDANDCVEDKWAKVLLAGKPIYVYDAYSEDSTDAYGNLPHEFSMKYDCVRYTLTLADIVKGLEKALMIGGWKSTYVNNLMQEDGDFDQIQAEALLQFIVFGEEVYG